MHAIHENLDMNYLTPWYMMDMIILKRNDMLSEYFSNIIGSILGIPVLYNLDETCYLIPYFFYTDWREHAMVSQIARLYHVPIKMGLWKLHDR